ncbi:MAG: S-layer homology domain-containing protein [Patescibacteria group bacterium]
MKNLSKFVASFLFFIILSQNVIAEDATSAVPGEEVQSEAVETPAQENSPEEAEKVDLPDPKFTDIENSQYKESIISLAKKGVVQGYGNGEFRPSQTINRAELLKIIFAAIAADAGNFAGGCFPDVQDEWFAPYVCKAKELAVIQGYPDGLYKPGQSVNMVEALKITIKAFGFPLPELKEGDVWYKPFMTFAHWNRLFSKYSYTPGRDARRDEVAFMVDQLLEVQREEEILYVYRDVRSPGCFKETAPAIPPTSFSVDGLDRSTITVIPETYSPGTPLSLIFAFHGRTNSNTMVRGYYGIEKAAEGQAIIVYPAGLPNAGGYSWSNAGDKSGDLRDYEFFDVMYKEFTENYCVNMDEVYVMGHSLGAWFSNSLACARGDKIRAVASLGGARSTSKCTGPVAVMQWHNPKDEQASFASAEAARNDFIAQNQCSKESVAVQPSWGNCVEYKGCLEDAPVLFCPHNVDTDYRGSYYPHTWPKDTGKEMWKFFKSLGE